MSDQLERFFRILVLRVRELRPENHWSVPAAWRVVVESESVAVWQLYANQHPMHQILDRIRAD